MSPLHIKKELLLCGDIKTEFFKVEDTGVNRLWQLFQLYNSEKALENYNKETFDSLVNQNRFFYGAVVTTINDDPIVFSGLGKYDNWVILTRLVILKYISFPFTAGHLFPKIIDIAKENKTDGVITTFNSYNQRMFHRITNPNIGGKYIRHVDSSAVLNHDIIKSAINTCSLFQKIDYTVNYQYTEQYVAYIPFKDTIPEFRRFNEL